MTKLFLVLIGLAVTVLIGAFVFAVVTIQAGHLVGFRPASTTVETRALFTPYIEPRKKRNVKKAD
jgi:hypothetical protein